MYLEKELLYADEIEDILSYRAFCGNGIIHSFESGVMVKVFKKH